MRKGLFLAVLTVALSAAWAAHLASQSQSLAEVAKAEEARRKTIRNATTKVYTNEDLKGTRETSSAPPAAASGASSGSTDATKPAQDSEPVRPIDPNAKDEKYWKSRLATAQQAVDRSKLLLDALQTRVNSLAADFVNRDDPAQRAVIETNRQQTLAELERLKGEIAAQTKEIANIHEEARKAGVPAGWLR